MGDFPRCNKCGQRLILRPDGLGVKPHYYCVIHDFNNQTRIGEETDNSFFTEID